MSAFGQGVEIAVARRCPPADAGRADAQDSPHRSGAGDGGALLVPQVPVLARAGTDLFAPDRPTLRPLDVETLLADAPAASDEVASVAPVTPVAFTSAETGGGEDWTAPWLGALLMVLGIAILLSASYSRQGAHAS